MTALRLAARRDAPYRNAVPRVAPLRTSPPLRATQRIATN
jgi:hypothetical protein